MEKRNRVAEADMVYYITAMVFATRESLRIIWGMVMVYSNSIKFKSIEETGRLMSYRGKGN